MDWNRVEGNWKQVKGKVKEQWGKLTDDDLDRIARLADRSAFGNAKISMMFDRKSFDLRKWSLTDERGQTTTITISNVKENVHVAEETFKIDYAANREYNTTTKSR